MAAAIAHGGVGNPPRNSDGCRTAVDRALAELERTGDPVEAAAAGVVVMEDDPRFNAGTGAVVRLDLRTVQMDAAVMRSDGRSGAVAAIERVKNPVLVARQVMETPHLLLAGDGAIRFARRMGHADHDPTTPRQRQKTLAVLRQWMNRDPQLPEVWRRFDLRRHWNFARPLDEVLEEVKQSPVPAADAGAASPPPPAPPPGPGSDTVGVVVRAPDGRYGAALSTGGWSMTLSGRVGDSALIGSGLYAGPAGAMAATGVGERIVEATLGRRMQRWLASGTSAREAARRAVAELAPKGPIGVIVMDATSMAAESSKPMAWAARETPLHRAIGPASSPD
jgi:isoaspartyl peptidase/L-asparaginase-like protein (Ntn-hydrolase superfamily)